MKVLFETFGCRLNKAEALQDEAEHLAKGWQLATNRAEADLIIVRGCSVTARAQRECERLIAHLKRHYPTTQIRTVGCLAKDTPSPLRRNISPKLIPAVDPAIIPTRTARAYLKVQDGCSGKCTYCIVPKFRGASVSLPFNELLDRAKRFIDAGYHEIVLTGCNLSLYANSGKRLAELLQALAALSPECRYRIGSLEPGAVARETIAAMSENANICRFLHLPVQSGSDRILMGMKRAYKIKDVDDLTTLALKLMPDIALGCDIITGFPAESEMDFIATQGLIKRIPFSNVHVFPFSERPGTLASTMNGVIDKAIRSHRAHIIAAMAKEKRYDFARKFIGKTVEVIVETDAKPRGWTAHYLWCNLFGSAPRKSLARAFITKAHHDGSLEGRLSPQRQH